MYDDTIGLPFCSTGLREDLDELVVIRKNILVSKIFLVTGLREDLDELAADLMQLQLTQRAVEEEMVAELESISLERKRR